MTYDIIDLQKSHVDVGNFY